MLHLHDIIVNTHSKPCTPFWDSIQKKIFDLSSSNNIVELYVFSIQIKTQRKSNIEIERLKRIFIV